MYFLYRTSSIQSLTGNHSRARAQRAFSLIEILIVVVILGILAAIAIPQFSNASQISRENVLKEDLRYLRTQILVYKAQHADVSPGVLEGDLKDGDFFVRQMMEYTDEQGNPNGASASSVYKYGPYLRKMPTNPLTDKTGVKILELNDAMTADETMDGGTIGWLYKPSTGEIRVNKTGSDSTGIAFANY